MDISKELAHDLLAHLECGDIVTCTDCHLDDSTCRRNMERCAAELRHALEGVEHNANVSQETRPKQGPPDLGLPEPDKVTQHITITVAEYHCLTKAATLLEAVLKAEKYNPTPVVDAARIVMQEMAEAGAAE